MTIRDELESLRDKINEILSSISEEAGRTHSGDDDEIEWLKWKFSIRATRRLRQYGITKWSQLFAMTDRDFKEMCGGGFCFGTAEKVKKIISKRKLLWKKH